MKKYKRAILYSLASLAAVFFFSGCKDQSKDEKAVYENFEYSAGIDDSGFWEGIRALDHVDLCDYSGISVPSEVHAVTEDAIKDEVDHILSGFAESRQINDRTIKDGDTVNIDYIGTVDGKGFEGGSTNGTGRAVTIGVTDYIDGFLEQLIGHAPGEVFDIIVSFPADYGNENLDGREAAFTVTVNHILETSIPELTDEFVSEELSSEYGWTTVSDMNAAIGENIRSSAISTFIHDYVLANSTVKNLPDKLIKYQENAMLSFYMEYADHYDMDMDAFISEQLGYSGTEELIDAYSEDIYKTAMSYLVFQAIAEDADISVEEEDIKSYFIRYFGSDDYSEHEEYFGTGYMKMVVLNEKVMSFLEAAALWEQHPTDPAPQ